MKTNIDFKKPISDIGFVNKDLNASINFSNPKNIKCEDGFISFNWKETIFGEDGKKNITFDRYQEININYIGGISVIYEAPKKK